MKNRILLWVLLVTVAAVCLFTVPNIVQSSIPVIYYITPEQKTYANLVNCTGTIYPENEYAVYASSSIVPAEIHAAPGDIVKEGEALLTVDKSAAEQLEGDALEGLPARAAQKLESEISAEQLAGILSSYGLPVDTDLDALLSAGSEDFLSNEIRPDVTLAESSSGTVTAPASGLITEIGAVSGRPVNPGQLLFTIQDVESYKVIAAVGEGDIAKISVGDKALIRGVGFRGITFDGTVSKIHPTARKTFSGTAADTIVDVEIMINNPNDQLKSGFSAKVEITGGQSFELVTVPYEAIRQDENNEEYVYVYEDGKLKKNLIVTGRELVSEVEVLEGLGVDSVVVFNPDDVTGEGTIVNIKGRA